MKTRVILSKSGTLTDLTVNSANYYNGVTTIDLTTSDYLYIGQTFPFNNLYFLMGTLNTTASNVTVKLWNSKEWIDVAELSDETNGFQSHGHMTFVPKKQENWHRDDTQNNNAQERVDGLGNVNIYDKYWIRISIDTNIDAGTTLKWNGSLFSDDNDLGTEYPELLLSNLLDSIESGKSDYQEQHVKAAELVISDLQSRNIIKHSGQILDKESVKNISVCKVAEIVYTMLGDDYEDNRALARKEYESRLKKNIFNVDLDEDGRLDIKESGFRHGVLSR